MGPEVQEKACPHHFVIMRQGALNKEATVEKHENPTFRPNAVHSIGSFEKKLDFNYRKMGMMTK